MTMPILDLEFAFMVTRTLAMVGALLVMAWAFRHWRRSAELEAQRLFEQLDLIRGELLLLSERLEHREVVTAPVMERAPQPEARPAAVIHSPPPRGYEVAARLARGGATCDELVSGCGLSRHEAELLLRLHGAEAARNKKAPEKAVEERRKRLSVVG